MQSETGIDTNLVDVVVGMFASHGGQGCMALLRSCFGACALELSPFLIQTLFEGSRGVLSVMMLTLLDRDDAMMVFFRQNLTILDWLDCGVIMILMDFSVDGCGHFFVLLLLDVFMGDGRGDLFMNGCVMLSRVGAVRPS